VDLAGKSVLVVCGGYRYYGAEAATLSLMKVMLRAGAHVECFTSEWSDGQFAAAVAAAGIPVRTAKFGWFYLRHPCWTMATLVSLPGAWRQFRTAIGALRPDHVIHSSYRTIAYFYPWLEYNNVLCVHDKLSADRQARRIVPAIGTKIARFWGCSQYVADDLREMDLPFARIATFPNFTDLTGCRRSGSPSGAVNIGIVGQINPNKGHITLFRALGELQRRGTPFELLIFGSGEEAFIGDLKRLASKLGIESHVRFCGFVPDKDAIYRVLDLVVVPTLTDEAFGLAALEPATYGIPVIASAKGGLPEVVEEGRTGFLFPAGDWRRLADLVQHIVNVPAEAAELGARGKRRAAQKFSHSAALERIREL